MAESASLKGVDKAAVFLMTLGEATAAQIVKHLGPREVQKIGSAMSGLHSISRDTINTTVDEFVDALANQSPLGIGNDDYIRNVLSSALGEDKAKSMLDRILDGNESKGLDSLKWMDARGVADIIGYEHPQIVAIVLSYLDSDQAGEVLSLLPEKIHADVTMRIAAMDGVQPAAMKELDDMIALQLRGQATGAAAGLGGLKCVADLLNFVDRGIGTKITEVISELDAELASKIQDLMFTFDNLADVDDRGIQVLLREISSENLVLALKGADDTMKGKIFKNMSQRAAGMLQEDLENRGPVKLSDVEGAQKEIIVIARRLADEGQLSLGGPGGEEMI